MSSSPFDYLDEEPTPRKKLDVTALVWNVLTLLVLAAACIIAVVSLTIFVNPQSGFNLFPPPTMPSLIRSATPTPTPKHVLPPTWTPTPEPTSTTVPTVTASNTPTLTPTELPPTETPQPTATIEAEPTSEEEPTSEVEPTAETEQSFQLQEGSPTYTQNFVHGENEEDRCQWLGVAGILVDINGEPITDSSIVIEIGGVLGEVEINELTVSGMPNGSPYGMGGYEIFLADHPIASTGTLWIQLSTPSAHMPLSEQIYFDTFEGCGMNLILLNFVQSE
ncbi:MAG: hypothetical protein DRI56_01620 [Chloroflexota bacterium]|nr:MAG: hypothetical protein DRI56_01620 [Chloroflexota bacterium]